MTLSDLIRKGGLARVATATTATVATQKTANAATVAPVATVAVANLRPPTTVMTAEEETAIRMWLAHIDETDAGMIAGALDQCRADVEARTYFLRRADEVPSSVSRDQPHLALYLDSG